MKITVTIAKAELRTLFYSPIAWLLLLVFLIQCSQLYFSPLGRMLDIQNRGEFNYLQFLTARMFGLPYGVFVQVLQNLYLYIPLLTMGLMSRETSSGTIKLLYSSPINVRQIIFGKYLAVVSYCLLLILILVGFVITSAINIQHVDYGLLFSGLLGIFLLLCTYSAIGLFMSCLTSYQVVAAISTLVTFALLKYIGSVGQGIDFIRNITYFLAVSDRTDHMLLGLITTNDLMYFILIIYIFISICIIKLQYERESRSIVLVSAKYAIVIISAVAIGYILDLPKNIAYFDATATKTQTTSKGMQTILTNMDKGALRVTTYINLLDNTYYLGDPSTRLMDLERWKPYLRFKPDIKLNYVYYYDTLGTDKSVLKNFPGKSVNQVIEILAHLNKVNLNRFLTPYQIRKLINLKQENGRYVTILEYQGRQTSLRVFDDQTKMPSDQEVGAALKRLLIKLPEIVFLQGEAERSKDKLGDIDYGSLTSKITFRYALVNQGFDIKTISLKHEDIPGDIACLVIADPRNSFDSASILKIQNYIALGGNVLIAGEPSRKAILEPIIEPLGVDFVNGTLVQEDKNNAPDLVMPLLTNSATILSKNLTSDLRDSVPVSMPGVSGLTFKTSGSFQIRALLMTNSKVSWNKVGKMNADSSNILFDPIAGDLRKSFPTAASLSRKINGKDQRIIITGDADFLSNAELARSGNYNTANFEFATDLFGWFSYGQFPIDTTRPASQDSKLNLTDSSLSKLQFLFAVFAGLLLVSAIIFLLRRRRK